MMDWMWGVVAFVVALVLTVWCSPQRDALLWWLLPGPVHRAIREVLGVELVKSILERRRRCPGARWQMAGTTYYWRKT